MLGRWADNLGVCVRDKDTGKIIWAEVVVEGSIAIALLLLLIAGMGMAGWLA